MMRQFVFLVLWLPLMALGQGAQPMADDPVVNKRAVQLAEELRCLVCQNQTIADSNAELAVDLRRQIRAQIADGRSDDDIRRFMVDRYGDFVLYRPPVNPVTLLLWFGPLALLAGGVILLWRTLRARSKRIEQTPLTDEQRRQAASLLAGRKEQ
jgi:cytochrome c-type biogenesis protein CcmH